MKQVNLYSLPSKSYFSILEDGEIYYLDHLDGMYSFCKDRNGNTVHIAGFQKVYAREKPKGFNLETKHNE